MIKMDDVETVLAHRRAVRGKSERAYGGPTSPWRVTQEAKVILQKFGVADLCAFVQKRKNSIVIEFLKPEALYARCIPADRFDSLLAELTQAVEACGYIVAFDDSAIHLNSVDSF